MRPEGDLDAVGGDATVQDVPEHFRLEALKMLGKIDANGHRIPETDGQQARDHFGHALFPSFLPPLFPRPIDGLAKHAAVLDVHRHAHGLDLLFDEGFAAQKLCQSPKLHQRIVCSHRIETPRQACNRDHSPIEATTPYKDARFQAMERMAGLVSVSDLAPTGPGT